MGFFASKIGKFSGSFSSGVLSLSLGGGSWGLGSSLSLDVTKPLSDGFAFVNSKLPAGAAPIEAAVEALIVTGVKAVSVSF